MRVSRRGGDDGRLVLGVGKLSQLLEDLVGGLLFGLALGCGWRGGLLDPPALVCQHDGGHPPHSRVLGTVVDRGVDGVLEVVLLAELLKPVLEERSALHLEKKRTQRKLQAEVTTTIGTSNLCNLRRLESLQVASAWLWKMVVVDVVVGCKLRSRQSIFEVPSWKTFHPGGVSRLFFL